MRFNRLLSVLMSSYITLMRVEVEQFSSAMAQKVFVCILAALVVIDAFVFDQEALNVTVFKRKLEKGLDRLMRYGSIGKDLKETLGVLPIDQIFREDEVYKPYNALLCTGCTVAGNALIKARRNGASRENMYDFARALCVNLHIQAEFVCVGVIDLNLDILMYIVDNNPDLTGAHACSILMQGFGCKSDTPSDWTIDIHAGESTPANPGSGKYVNILHLTDIHYDPLYQEGSLAKCTHPMCCQVDSGIVLLNEDTAGYWTDYSSCDVPSYLLEDTLRHISKNHDLEYVYYTGDIISHRVWETSIKNNTEDHQYVLGQFKKYFGDVPVFPIMGNHEPHPLNVWSPNNVEKDISTKWVFDLLADEWAVWLGDECKETIKAGGYYTKLVKPGFRIVGLNSNVAYSFNWWLMYNDVDNFGQLVWLENVLYEAEQNKENVHILSHIPTGSSSAYGPWMTQFLRILKRYQNTVTGIFNGHTHDDELIVYHNDDSSPIKVVGLNGGSLTPYADRNPGYRVMKIDDTNYDVLDYDQYMFDVAEANANGQETSPRWRKLYRFTEAYQTKAVFGQDVSDLTRRMAEEPKKGLLKQYITFMSRDGPKAMDTCDEECLKFNLKKLVVTYSGDHEHADKLMDVWQFAVDENN